MKYYSVDPGYGRVKTGQYDWVWVPGTQRPAGKLGILYYHGSGHQLGSMDPTQPLSSMIAPRLALAGIPVVSAEFDDQAWGNADAMADGLTAVSVLNTVCGTPNDGIIAMGASMGAYTALRFAKENPSLVKAVVGIIPLTNMTYFYSNNIGGGQAEIAGAWGVTAPADLPAASQIQEVAASFAMPIRLYYSDADALIRPTDTLDFAAAAPNADVFDVGSNGHSDQTLGDAQNYNGARAIDIINFCKENGA